MSMYNMLFGVNHFTVVVLAILISSAITIVELGGAVLEFQVKMKALDVCSKAVDKGLELRLNGDLLKGIDLVKIMNNRIIRSH